jgi:hypothetical protein
LASPGAPVYARALLLEQQAVDIAAALRKSYQPDGEEMAIICDEEYAVQSGSGSKYKHRHGRS